jgi:hypothetical protein
MERVPVVAVGAHGSNSANQRARDRNADRMIGGSSWINQGDAYVFGDRTNDRNDARGSDSEDTSLGAAPRIAIAEADDREAERDWGRVWETDELLDLARSYACGLHAKRLSEGYARKLPR